MGSGKTTIGRRVAERLDLEFVDCDAEIEKRTGAAIALIFDIEGEEGFRTREHRLLEELSRKKGILLATGGGVVMLAENRRLLQERGFIVYLETSVDKQLERLRRDKQRPLLQADDRRQKLENLARLRNPHYQELADLVIPSTARSVRHMAAKVSDAIADFWLTQAEQETYEDD